jgi:class 3 adenylate cyclase
MSGRSGQSVRVAESLKMPGLPADPVLAVAASALNEVGYLAQLLDTSWRFVFVTDEMARMFAAIGAATPPLVGWHYFGAEAVRHRQETTGGMHAVREGYRAFFSDLGPYVLASTSGGRDALRQLVDPDLADLVDGMEPREIPAMWVSQLRWKFFGTVVTGSILWTRIDDRRGQFAGLCTQIKPAAGMQQISAALAGADLAHLERMRVVERPDRRPAAILMADLEASSPLSRRLSAAQYFAFGSHLVRAADQCVVDAGGIVGRHQGDGVVAYFLADTAGSESAAARACITAARALRDMLPDIAMRSDIADSELSLRFGLHWGATLYVGRIVTAGRSEVTAQGDEANEAARIEACATGARVLASKSLIERLGRADADALGIDTTHTTYTRLADLATATEKARRDAPSIAVCEV